MAFANIIDVDAMALAIPGDSPQGEDIRSDRSPTSDYYTIKDARNSARAAERSAMFDDNDSDLLAPWRNVAKSAEKILTEKSKDLEVASWYTEALIRLHGVAGLRDGFELISRLVSEHWDGLYPEPDEDGMETKVAPLAGLNGDGADGTLLMPIRNAEITPEGDFGGFSFFQYQQARDAEKIADDDARAARVETLGYGMSQVESCVNSADVSWASGLIETLEESSQYYREINNTLREKCGQDAPPSSSISGLIDEVLRTARFIYKEKLESLAESVTVETTSEQDEVANVTGDGATSAAQSYTVVPTGAITSREDALRLLEKAAKYFRTYEPHTPLAPGLERLVGWGRMTVAELMTELLPDDQSRSIYSQLTGVKLDGTDNQRYVAPPSVKPPAAGGDENESSSTGGAESQENRWDQAEKKVETEPSW
ncbi:type VI secretion system protein TssA [Microbulbifer aggregans]|uniref:type VI secretion system protein TssA n=1 Tax=Microbulbifer aggregans TaxID=1769779 RepID=UPI001CFD9E5A|nr:type VI secretion system protein TssA [Microbulbifer aggregans]